MGDTDEDREAILRRRSQLIALALGGLGAIGCEAPPAPPASAEETQSAQVEPMTPLGPEDHAAEPPDEAPPEVRDAPDPAEIAHAEERKRRARRPPPMPHPCLSTVAPIPSICLSVAPMPMACLEKA